MNGAGFDESFVLGGSEISVHKTTKPRSTAGQVKTELKLRHCSGSSGAKLRCYQKSIMQLKIHSVGLSLKPSASFCFLSNLRVMIRDRPLNGKFCFVNSMRLVLILDFREPSCRIIP